MGGLPHDIQICLGCNDQMTAKYISEKCGYVTINVRNNQFPLTPLFAPIYNSTRPYSQTRSNTQRLLMMPDEVLQLDNRKCLVFLRGQKPMLLYKIIPDEFILFSKLRITPVKEHIPLWRNQLNHTTRTRPKQETVPPSPDVTPPAEHIEQVEEITTAITAPKEYDDCLFIERPIGFVLGEHDTDDTLHF